MKGSILVKVLVKALEAVEAGQILSFCEIPAIFFFGKTKFFDRFF